MILLKNKKVAILGLLAPAIAAIQFAHKQNARVKAYGIATAKELEVHRKNLGSIPCELIVDDLPPNALDDEEVIILTPGGARRYAIPIENAKRKGCAVISDLDLAFQHFKSPVIAVTGTNGKTTVIHMIKSILESAGKKVLVGGGEFPPFLQLLLKPTPCDYVLLELNSSRLARSELFHPYLAILLNIYVGHYERHSSFNEYKLAKAKIYQKQTKEEFLIHRGDREILDLCKRYPPLSQQYVFGFSENPLPGAFMHIKDKTIEFVSAKKERAHYDFKNSSIWGNPNHENILAAICAAKICKISDEDIQKAINELKPLPNRMEFLQKIGGVSYINDAKSVNVMGTLLNLFAFPPTSVVLIAGGEYMSKQYYDQLGPMLSEKVRCLIIFGTYRKKFYEKWGDKTETFLVTSLKDAVMLASQKAEKSNCVLFSPASRPEPHIHASVQNRGNEFKRLVKEVEKIEKAKIVNRRI